MASAVVSAMSASSLTVSTHRGHVSQKDDRSEVERPRVEPQLRHVGAITPLTNAGANDATGLRWRD